VNHREVGVHTSRSATALRGALREDPDIILVGEMRDLETIDCHHRRRHRPLVFGTLHTQSAAKTVESYQLTSSRPTSKTNPQTLSEA